MGNRVGIARHRAEVAKTSSIAVIAKAVSENAGGVGRQAAVIAAASGLVLTTGVTANAVEPTTAQRDSSAAAVNIAAAPTVTASATVKIAFESPAVSSTPAPPKPVVKVQSAAPAKPVAPAASAAPAAPQAQAPASVPGADASAAASAGAAAGVAVSAAIAQLGVSQDCTALVRNALNAAGLKSTLMGPSEFYKVGTIISAAQAQPGDIAYYSNNGYGGQHVAIYIGNGQAVHGGWLGNQTVMASVNIPTGPPDYFIRPSK